MKDKQRDWKDDNKIPLTRAIDWFGAAKVMQPMEPRPPRGPTVFHVFRASPSSGCFAITASADTSGLPANPESAHLPFPDAPQRKQDR